MRDVGGVKLDKLFMGQLDEVLQMADELPPDRKNQIMSILKNKLQANATPAGRMSGESFKKAESELRRLGVTYLKSPDPDQRKLGEALSQVGHNLRGVLKRQDPGLASKLKNVDKSWAGLKRIERAAGYVGGESGSFLPLNFCLLLRPQIDQWVSLRFPEEMRTCRTGLKSLKTSWAIRSETVTPQIG